MQQAQLDIYTAKVFKNKAGQSIHLPELVTIMDLKRYVVFMFYLAWLIFFVLEQTKNIY